MKKYFLILFLSLSVALVNFNFSSAANANLIGVNVSFTAVGSATGFPNDPPQDPIPGSFGFQYNDSTLLIGVENLILTPMIVNFSINGFVYNESNTGLIVRFSNKVITDILFGGLENGVAVLFSGTDDFFFSNSASENLGVGVLHYSTQTDPRIFASARSPMAVNFTEFQVSEPSTVAIFALGLIGLFFVRWRLPPGLGLSL